MADDLVLPATGGTVAADLIGSASYQRVKLSFGADGAAADWDGTQHIGEVGGRLKLVQVTFTMGTTAYGAGDVLADTQIITACMRADAGAGYLQSLTLNDKDDQGLPLDVYIIQTNTSLGTENSAPDISDANADNILGWFSVAAADYKDVGGAKLASLRNIGLPVIAAGGADDLYVALVTQGTPTHSGSGITGWFGFDCY